MKRYIRCGIYPDQVDDYLDTQEHFDSIENFGAIAYAVEYFDWGKYQGQYFDNLEDCYRYIKKNKFDDYYITMSKWTDPVWGSHMSTVMYEDHRKPHDDEVPEVPVVDVYENSEDSEYASIPIYYTVYELDDDGDEIDSVDSFDTLAEAISFAESCDFPAHICFVPSMDPDDDPGYAEYIEYAYDYEPYEVVWSSI